jgi:hypothetical protein
VPTNPISSATKGPTTAAAIILSQAEPVIRLSIPAFFPSSRRQTSRPDRDQLSAGFDPIQWFQVEHESGQEDLGIGEDFGLD